MQRDATRCNATARVAGQLLDYYGHHACNVLAFAYGVAGQLDDYIVFFDTYVIVNPLALH